MAGYLARPTAVEPPVELNAPSLVDALHADIRRRIMTGEVPAGSRLTETELASQYSVARPTAKAAIERLVQDGLLRRPSNKTARVPILDQDDVRDLYRVRGIIEREVVMALAADANVPEGAVRSVAQMRQLIPAPTVTEVVAADIAFHRALVEAAGSERVLRLYTSLMGEVNLCMAQVQAHRLLSPARIANEHEAVIEAVALGDEKRALAAIDTHLQRSRDRLVAHVRAQRL